MAKNKRDRKQQKSSPAEQGKERAEQSSMEAMSQTQQHAQGSPADVARKHQRRFGHN
ncbi:MULTISPECIES: hypothetical protein [Streptomyces]|uniref:Small hydrophilic protein n=2 Tax=Streptomyces TaxID=1883 RepID=A0A0B5ETN7_STRA4|nr:MULTISPECIES: hypothetical protein [Streptomyces]AJE86203.1 hypothetical protein SLNWT_5827 [Streptomyces albus]AOU80505.1 hypothetical protein SLNHY_5814 [Streptomyces albus]AYN36216.1 hypothetical protein DUI70_5721 [Streptomyces albus]NKI41378.1 hypothetical protein [Streptomyces physcomitrii]